MSSARANIITFPLNSITRSSSNDFAECEINRYGMKGIGPALTATLRQNVKTTPRARLLVLNKRLTWKPGSVWLDYSERFVSDSNFPPGRRLPMSRGPRRFFVNRKFSHSCPRNRRFSEMRTNNRSTVTILLHARSMSLSDFKVKKRRKGLHGKS